MRYCSNESKRGCRGLPVGVGAITPGIGAMTIYLLGRFSSEVVQVADFRLGEQAFIVLSNRNDLVRK